MTLDEAKRILEPWILAGIKSVKEEPSYGPGPRLWGCAEKNFHITYLPHCELFKKYKTPQFDSRGTNLPEHNTWREAANVFAAYYNGPKF